MLDQYFPVLLQFMIATGFAVTTLVLSVMLGKSARRNSVKDSPYECGMIPVGQHQPRFSVKFYLVAMLFVIFDIEVVFMYPWALTFRDFVSNGQGGMVFWSMSGFVGILLVAYLYALKKGALSWKS